jgi:hypothetical protein
VGDGINDREGECSQRENRRANRIIGVNSLYFAFSISLIYALAAVIDVTQGQCKRKLTAVELNLTVGRTKS